MFAALAGFFMLLIVLAGCCANAFNPYVTYLEAPVLEVVPVWCVVALFEGWVVVAAVFHLFSEVKIPTVSFVFAHSAQIGLRS